MTFDIPRWDKASQDAIRTALSGLGATIPDSRGMFGKRNQVAPIRHLIGSVVAWGGVPERDAFYQLVTPERNDGTTNYRLDLPKVPVDAFWSVSVYDAAGAFRPNPQNAYSINSLTAKKGEGGQFPSALAAAAQRRRTVCRSCRDGTTWFATICHAPRYLMASGSYQCPCRHLNPCTRTRRIRLV